MSHVIEPSTPYSIHAIDPCTHTPNKSQGAYFTCHGPEAAKIGREFYATDTVVRHQGERNPCIVCVCMHMMLSRRTPG